MGWTSYESEWLRVLKIKIGWTFYWVFCLGSVWIPLIAENWKLITENTVAK